MQVLIITLSMGRAHGLQLGLYRHSLSAPVWLKVQSESYPPTHLPMAPVTPMPSAAHKFRPWRRQCLYSRYYVTGEQYVY